jgi:hypothetical protein
MAKIKLGKDAAMVFDTVLTQAQVSKFNRLAQHLMIVGATPYLRLDELHGALLTKSKQSAIDLVMANHETVKPYLTTDKVGFAPYGLTSAIRPMGVYVLLEHLAHINPKKALQYRASIALLALLLSNHPQLMIVSLTQGRDLDQAVGAIIQKLKRQHSICQLTGTAFAAGTEKHVHHIEAAALNPQLAAEPTNLVVIQGWVHDAYHHWAEKRGLHVCRATLGLFAVERHFSTPFVNSLKAS